jgi:hypothetical protein
MVSGRRFVIKMGLFLIVTLIFLHFLKPGERCGGARLRGPRRYMGGEPDEPPLRVSRRAGRA